MEKVSTPVSYLDAPEFAKYWERDARRLAVAVEKIVRGIPVNVEYVRDGNRMIVSKVVVRKAPVVEHRTTTTTTTRKLTHDEKEALEKEKERLEDLEDDDD